MAGLGFLTLYASWNHLNEVGEFINTISFTQGDKIVIVGTVIAMLLGAHYLTIVITIALIHFYKRLASRHAFWRT